MTTIGFFGDSFCESQARDSWCVLLANKLDCDITHWGKGGASIWNTFIEYEHLEEQDVLPDIMIFCWTEPYRLYHRTLPIAKGAIPIAGADKNIYKAADMYYVYLQDYAKDELAYRYALQWFDQNELAKSSDKKIVQTWSIKPFELSGKSIDIKLTTGKFIDESMLMFAWDGVPKEIKFDPALSNHMSTEQNQRWADKVYQNII